MVPSSGNFSASIPADKKSIKKSKKKNKIKKTLKKIKIKKGKKGVTDQIEGVILGRYFSSTRQVNAYLYFLFELASY